MGRRDGTGMETAHDREERSWCETSKSAGGGVLRREGSLVGRVLGEGFVEEVLIPGLKSLGGSPGLFWSSPSSANQFPLTWLP